MNDQLYSIQSNEKEDYNKKTQSQNHMNTQLNKTYDECNMQKIILSIASKILPIAIYLIFKLLTNVFLGLFILIVLLLAVDFWICKNILGPKLAGIRWFIKQNQQNQAKWCFSGCSQSRVLSKINVIAFWFPQLFAILFWIVIFLINMITLSMFWSGLAIFSCLLLIINFVSFVQCKGQHQKKVNSITKRFGYQIYHDQKQ